MTTTLRLGIAGLGTVGAEVVRILARSPDMIGARAGRPLQVVAVSARSRDKDRGVDLSRYDWEDDPVALARRTDIDVFVELMGGSDGPAKAATEAALERGAHIVTANNQHSFPDSNNRGTSAIVMSVFPKNTPRKSSWSITIIIFGCVILLRRLRCRPSLNTIEPNFNLSIFPSSLRISLPSKASRI